jgi:hypothetical protein
MKSTIGEVKAWVTGSGLPKAIQLPEKLVEVVEEGGRVADEPQARRAASGDRRRRRSPGCMGGMIRLAGLSGMKKWVGLRVPGYTYCII